MSLEWLFNNTSVLLWASKLLVAAPDFANIHRQLIFDDEEDRECARILFDRLHDEGVVDVFDPGRYLNKTTLTSIQLQVALDSRRWGVDSPTPPPGERPDHCVVQVGSDRYCPPLMLGIYGSLTLARFLNCSCVFDTPGRKFLEARFSDICDFGEYQSGGQQVFSNLYRVLVPGVSPDGDYKLFCNPSRSATCKYADDCRRNAKANLERMLDFILIAREKPELRRLAERLDSLESEIGPDESAIKRALLRDIRREQRNLRLAYPTFTRWARLTQVASAPALLYGTQTGQPLIWISAAGLAAVAEALHVSVDVLSERHRWLTLMADAIERGPVRAQEAGLKGEK